MADINITSTDTSKVEPKQNNQKKPKVNRPKTSHPTTAVMVNAAIKSLKDRGGSSLQAIKKYISVTYKVDAEKLAPFIRKYLKNSVASGILIQTKGKGASGSFKLATESTTKKVNSKKNETAKKSIESKVQKKKTVNKIKIAGPKAKKSAKLPTKKPKSPKPKTVKSSKTAVAKATKN